MMKKIISLVLVAALALSMMVVSVSAAGTADNYSRGEWIKEIAEAAGADVSNATMPAGKGVDVKTTDEYFKYIAWGYTEGIIKGYNEEGFPFKAAQDVKLQEAMAMVTRAIKEEILPAVPVSVDEANTEGMSETFVSEGVAAACVLYGLSDGSEADWTAPIAKDAADEVEIILGVAAGEIASPVAQPNVKFQLAVLSGENADEGYVKATVYETYAMVIEIGKAKVDPAHVTLEAMMNNVASLGGGVKNHKISVETGLTGDPDLSVWLSNCFDFGGAEIEITVGTKTCVYNVQPVVDADKSVSIAFIPEKIEDTRAAWMALTDNISTESQTADNSFVFIAPESELVIGEENLVFEQGSDGLKLDNFSNLDALKEAIRKELKLGTGYADNAYVGATIVGGTQLAVGQTVATLDKTCEILVDGIDMDLILDAAILSKLQVNDDADTYGMAQKLVTMINNLVGAIDDANETVKINVQFAD